MVAGEGVVHMQMQVRFRSLCAVVGLACYPTTYAHVDGDPSVCFDFSAHWMCRVFRVDLGNDKPEAYRANAPRQGVSETVHAPTPGSQMYRSCSA